uniref:Heterochromatin protein 1 n=1 Tax=Phallusia mammillata TaxID=59560 RepID=A0A6F9D7U4_9ASCI|nr:chromobox protein homolog 1-like [Phallusia mammillata]
MFLASWFRSLIDFSLNTMGKKKDSELEVENDLEQEGDEYEVERVVDKKIVKGKIQYLIKWKGFSDSDNTWEPDDNLDCPDLIADFENKASKDKKPKDGAKVDDKKRKLTEKTESAKKSRISEELRPRGFARGLNPEKIIGATDSGGQLTFLMKWEGSDEADLVASEEANIKCPQVVIKFYEERLTWHQSSPDDQS